MAAKLIPLFEDAATRRMLSRTVLPRSVSSLVAPHRSTAQDVPCPTTVTDWVIPAPLRGGRGSIRAPRWRAAPADRPAVVMRKQGSNGAPAPTNSPQDLASDQNIDCLGNVSPIDAQQALVDAVLDAPSPAPSLRLARPSDSR